MDFDLQAKERSCSTSVHVKCIGMTHLKQCFINGNGLNSLRPGCMLIMLALFRRVRVFLIIIDAYSKWIEIHITNSATSAVTIDKLRNTFVTFGLPEIFVTNNRSNFTSTEYQEFLKSNGIRHVRTVQYIQPPTAWLNVLSSLSTCG